MDDDKPYVSADAMRAAARHAQQLPRATQAAIAEELLAGTPAAALTGDGGASDLGGDESVPVRNPNLIGHWSDGLFRCSDSTSTMCVAFTFPCVSFASTASRTREIGFCKAMGLWMLPVLIAAFFLWLAIFVGNAYLLILFAIAWFAAASIGAYYRQRLRERFQIPGALALDLVYHLLTPWCALAQEARHVERDFEVPV